MNGVNCSNLIRINCNLLFLVKDSTTSNGIRSRIHVSQPRLKHTETTTTDSATRFRPSFLKTYHTKITWSDKLQEKHSILDIDERSALSSSSLRHIQACESACANVLEKRDFTSMCRIGSATTEGSKYGLITLSQLEYVGG